MTIVREMKTEMLLFYDTPHKHRLQAELAELLEDGSFVKCSRMHLHMLVSWISLFRTHYSGEFIETSDTRAVIRSIHG